MNRYIELWGWLCEVFGDQSFTLDKFRAEFPSPDPAKVVYDLVKLNLITRLETGIYRSASPLDFSRMMVKQSMSKEKLLTSPPARFAYFMMTRSESGQTAITGQGSPQDTSPFTSR